MQYSKKILKTLFGNKNEKKRRAFLEHQKKNLTIKIS